MATIFGSIFVFLLIIALHEFGHFSVAKAVGIRVNEFSIGMGPKIFQKKKGETSYSLRGLPIGGYVAMEGEEENSNDPRSFNNASVLNRLAVIVSGAGMNFILAIIAFFLSFLFLGNPSNQIGDIMENSPAYDAGLMNGDKIIAINGYETSSWNDIVDRIMNSEGETSIQVTRKGETLTKQILPEEQEGRRIIGITRSKNLFVSLQYAFITTFEVVKTIITLLSQLFTGGFSVNDLSGPVGVVQVIGQSASSGFASLLFLTGYISANLGFMNLLPIPALDGGKVVFLLIEWIRGKAIDEKWEMRLSLLGISLLFGLMIYVTIFGDLARLIGK